MNSNKALRWEQFQAEGKLSKENVSDKIILSVYDKEQYAGKVNSWKGIL